MAARPLPIFRFLELAITGLFGVVGLLILVNPRHAYGVGFAFLGIAAITFALFELRFWGHRRNVARVARELAEVGRRDLEAATPVRQRGTDDFVEELASNASIAGMMARRSHRLCITGTWRGHQLELGTAIVAGRDFDQMISYVCVLDAAQRGPFRVMTRGALTSFARLGMDTHPVPTGDPDFDAKWVVDATEVLARSVLDPDLRADLVRLQAQLAWMQVASVEWTRLGLLIRWPGELSADGAAYLRDLALGVHRRLSAGA
jgi:hypothetical protein